MEGLDLLKKEWNKESNFRKITESEIYKMIHKKSSSIVKWIFIISVLEILFWLGINFLTVDDNYLKMVKSYHLSSFVMIATVIHYIVLIVFIVIFYNNSRKISNTSSTKKLMKNILNVRKVVKYYVWYNIALVFISMSVFMANMLQYDPNITTIFNKASASGEETGLWVGLIISFIVMTLLMIGLLWLFYRVIYGILLRRLHKNYRELKKMEI